MGNAIATVGLIYAHLYSRPERGFIKLQGVAGIGAGVERKGLRLVHKRA